MKVAILIVGEYRTFEFCRKTMKFLDQTNLEKDIYFSTWNITATENPLYIKETHTWTNTTRKVTTQEIQNVLGVPAKIKIHDYDTVCPARKLAFTLGWRLGFQMIEESQQLYDYVYVLRPDLFFKGQSIFKTDEFKKFEDQIGVSDHITPQGHVDDTSFFSTYKNIEKILDNKLLDLDPESGIWHKTFADHIKAKNLKFDIIPMVDTTNLIGRFPMTNKTKFPTVQKNFLRNVYRYK